MLPEARDLSADELEAATALVTAVAGAEGSDPRRSDEPFDVKGKVTIRRAGGDVTEVVEIGAPDASGDVVVRRAFDGARLHVAAAVASRLLRGAWRFVAMISGRRRSKGSRWPPSKPTATGSSSA